MLFSNFFGMWINGDDVVIMNMTHCDGGKVLSILRLLIMKGSFKMLRNVLFKQVAFEIPLFKEVEQKENFLFVLGALVTRLISLQKAAEIMEMEPDMFLKILELMNIEFSYLSEDDVFIEREWLSS